MKVSPALFLIGLIATGCGTAQTAEQYTSSFTPTSAYKKETIQGFTFLFSPQVLQQKAKAAELRQEIEQQLKNIHCVVPASHLARLRKVRTWVEWTSSLKVAATFHPGAKWLKDKGYNPDKLGAIEIADATKFVDYSSTEQPWLFLHELSHAYHFHVLGYTHGGIEKAFVSARDGGSYHNVRHVDGTTRNAYFVQEDSQQEYFAELSEAYFGRNDYFPFTRKELESHDPDGHKLLVHLWGEPNRPAANCR